MTDLYKKVYRLAEQGLEDPVPVKMLRQELDYLEENNLLEHIYMLYRKIYIDKTHAKGDENINSLVAFALGITSEKHTDQPFVHKKRRTYGRKGFPDIDMDFDYLYKHRILEYCIEKYGSDCVSPIGMNQTLRVKASVRRTIKVLDPSNTIKFDSNGKMITSSDGNRSFEMENIILRTLPEQQKMKKPDGTFINTVEEACQQFPEFKAHMENYPEVKRIASKMTGRIAGYGVHPAGIVISNTPLKRICPLHTTTKKAASSEDGAVKTEKVFSTQFSMDHVESMGLIKIDVLGLSTKTAIAKATKLVKERHDIDLPMGSLPLDDKAALDLLNSGKTDGCFQLEEKGMQHTLQQIGIQSYNDLVVACAMYRPGPKDYIPELAGRKRGTVPISYPHPIMANITSVTYGVMIYQEQVMKVFMQMGDLSASEGYSFIKGCAKKKRALIEEPKERFFKGALKKGVPQEVIQRVWDDMEKFGGYAFNKSHACCYAYESFKTAYLKSHFPLEFIAARLSVENERRKFDKVEKYENDARYNLSIKIEPPNLNESKVDYAIVGENALRRPLLVKGIGLKAAQEIVKHQPYNGSDLLFTFVMKVASCVNTRVIESMFDIGLWSNYKKKAHLMSDFDKIKKDKKRGAGRPRGDMFE